MNLVDLESFVAVVDSGSVMAAASRLHLTQSAVSVVFKVLRMSWASLCSIVRCGHSSPREPVRLLMILRSRSWRM